MNRNPLHHPSVLAAIVVTGLGTLHGATPIYFDDFSGLSLNPLNGTAPDIRNAVAGGIASATWTALDTTWKANGTVNNTQSIAYLPFNPQAGLIYTLSVNVTATNNSEDWLAAGFTTSGMDLGQSLFAYQTPAMLLRGVPASGTNVSAFPKGVIVTPRNGTNTFFDAGTPANGIFSMVLDTRSPFWEVEWFFDGNSFKTFSYSLSDPNPSITGIGIGSFATGAGSVDNFSLSYVPEPSGAAVCALLTAGCLRRTRARVRG